MFINHSGSRYSTAALAAILKSADPGFILTYEERTLLVRDEPGLVRYEVCDHSIAEMSDGTTWAHAHCLTETKNVWLALKALVTGDEVAWG